EIFANAPLTQLAPHARALEAAEGSIRPHLATAIDPYGASLDARRELAPVLDIRRVNVGRQPVDGVVGEADCLLLVLECQQYRYRSENLLLDGASMRIQPADHHRID